MYRTRWLLLSFVFALLVAFPTLTLAHPLTQEVVEGGETPVTLVDHDVGNIYIQNAKVWFWYKLSCIPTAAPEGGTRIEEISRIATTGGMTRTVWFNEANPNCGSFQDDLNSNVVADDDYLYWMSDSADGLVRLSVEANPGDVPSEIYSAQGDANEIEERGNYVYLISSSYGLVRVAKATGAANTIVNAATVGTNPRDLQVSDEYVFWRNDNFGLQVVNFGGQGNGYSGAGTFVAENALCPVAGPCPSTDYVFVTNGETIRRYNVDTGTAGGVLYDGPVNDATITDITVDGSRLYWVESRPINCEPFCQYNYSMWRMTRTGGTAELIYQFPEQDFGLLNADLKLGGPNNAYLYFIDGGQLKRLPKDAAAIPSIDVDITDIEVNQAIQDLDQTVLLVRDKRTGVRVHVDALGQNVQGMTAYLYLINGSGTVLEGPISPSNGTGQITAQNNPDRATFDHAFYFELPMTWVEGSTLRLRAEINPIRVPPEPNYANNTENTATLSLLESPTLKTHLIMWGYTVDGTYYQPNLYNDGYQAQSWIRRTYPLASTPGGYNSSAAGFRLAIRTIDDPNLGEHVQQTSDFCLDIEADDREFCAATYTNNYANALRIGEGIPNDELIYSMIWDEDSLPFPRGFATGNVSAGPTGPSTWGWDNDGSYGDWYMGHEVGHNVGRPHPDDGNSDDPSTKNTREGCGHSPSDPDFPYPFTEIGLGTTWGLDVGDRGLNADLQPRVYSNATWTDMMGYCDRQWISDYTYEEIYDFLATRRPAVDPAPARAGGDTIALFGTIVPDETPTALIQMAGLWDSAGPYSPPSGTTYRMRFLDSGNGELAAYTFDGEGTDGDETLLGFQVVVPFPAGARTVQLVQVSSGAVLATKTISTNAPTVSNVALVSPSAPVTGTVTLQWQASDPDGDALTYDVYYTPDGGVSMRAFAVGLTTPSVSVDTTQLAGSNSGAFRVIANDGVRQGEATSPAYDIADKAARVTFLTPENGVEVRYGTQVNFSVEVDDLQGNVPDAGISWRIDGAVVSGATGPYFTAEALAVGTHTITARVTNSVGIVTSQSITVVVNDDLAYPAATLVVGPDQLGWHVGIGTVAPQQDTLMVSNIGTGTVAWTASETAPWLSLNVSSGSNAGVITVTADPTQVMAGTDTSTVITITGDNGQTVTVPVSLRVGVSGAWFPADAPVGGGSLYLPLIQQRMP